MGYFDFLNSKKRSLTNILVKRQPMVLLEETKLKEGFDSDFYLNMYPDIANAGIDPFTHYKNYGVYEGRLKKPAFSQSIESMEPPEGPIDPVEDEVKFEEDFDPDFYLKTYADVANARLDPYAHYKDHGIHEGRSKKALSSDSINSNDEAKLNDIDPDFDADFYLKMYPDVAGAHLDPFAHYKNYGVYEGRLKKPAFSQSIESMEPPEGPIDPVEDEVKFEEDFDPDFYLKTYADVANARLDPYAHYKDHGIHEGRSKKALSSDSINSNDEAKLNDIDPDFDADFYLKMYPDVAGAHLDPFAHYKNYGMHEGRLKKASPIEFTGSLDEVKPEKDTLLIVSHQASLTGAPILCFHLAKKLSAQYQIVILLLQNGELIKSFRSTGAVVGVLSDTNLENMLETMLKKCKFKYALVNSVGSSAVLPILAKNKIPSILLIHEFLAYVKAESFVKAVTSATQTVFSSKRILNEVLLAHPECNPNTFHVLPQGRCLPPSEFLIDNFNLPAEKARLKHALRPRTEHKLFVVLGAGAIELRKGVDFFIACAAHLKIERPDLHFRFVWIGKGYDPNNELGYSPYSELLADQIKRSNLEEMVFIIPETKAIQYAYEQADLFLLTSRLDPLPNVAIDALHEGLPLICFEKVSGIADFLTEIDMTRYCVAEYWNPKDMANKVAVLESSLNLRKQLSALLKKEAMNKFNINNYIHALDKIASNAAANVLKNTLGKDQELIAPAAFNKSNIRIIYISGAPNCPSEIYRVLRYEEAANAAGFLATHFPADDIFNHLDEIGKADIIIIWRAPWSDGIAKIVETVSTSGARIIFDIDDLLFDPTLAKPSIIDGIRSMQNNEEDFYDHCKLMHKTYSIANFYTAPTSFLCKRMHNHPSAVSMLPNGFDMHTLNVSRYALRCRKQHIPDGLLRIGYAAGTLTHQNDFSQIVPVIVRILQEHPNARLVLFQHNTIQLLQISEFPELELVLDQIEWRSFVSLAELPFEIARFDINLAPLEVENLFCNAKSELKYFEAALVEVPTIASPTEPYREAIQNGVTGFLALTPKKWYDALVLLINNSELRQQMGRAAFHDVLWKYGPERRIELMKLMVEQLCYKGLHAAHAFELSISKQLRSKPPLPVIPEHEILLEIDRLQASEVSVSISLYNSGHYLEEVLGSVKSQAFFDLDLILVDDASSDHSIEIAKAWIEKNTYRFNRIVLARNLKSSGLALTRNAGFCLAETPFVLTFDSENRLLPDCTELCLEAIKIHHAAFTYSDTTVLIRKAAWAAIGGYHEKKAAEEDFDLGHKFAEFGLFGVQIPQILARSGLQEKTQCQTKLDALYNKNSLQPA